MQVVLLALTVCVFVAPPFPYVWHKHYKFLHLNIIFIHYCNQALFEATVFCYMHFSFTYLLLAQVLHDRMVYEGLHCTILYLVAPSARLVSLKFQCWKSWQGECLQKKKNTAYTIMLVNVKLNMYTSDLSENHWMIIYLLYLDTLGEKLPFWKTTFMLTSRLVSMLPTAKKSSLIRRTTQGSWTLRAALHSSSNVKYFTRTGTEGAFRVTCKI